MTAPASVSIGDLEYAYLKAACPAPDNNLAVNLGQGVTTNSGQVANKYQTQSASGTQTAPTAGLAIASLTIATAGYYKVQVIVGFGGTAESTAVDNMRLKNDTTNVATTPVANVANTQSQTYEFYQTVAAGKNLTVNAIAAASASSVYKATIIATQVA